MTRLVLALALCTTVAHADKRVGASEFTEGRKLYSSGDYLGAATKFEAAFRHDPDPAYIFNVGQAYRRRAEQKASGMERDCAHSARAYELFLQLVPEPPNRNEVDTYLEEMVRCAGKQLAKVEPYKLPTQEPDKVEPDKVEPDKVDTHDDKPIGPTAGARVDSPARSQLTTAGLVVGGIGAVGLGVAGYFAYRGNAAQSDQDAPGLSGLRWQELDDQGRAANRNAKIFGIAGGAAVATGVVLYMLGRKHDREHRVTVVPARSGAAVAVRF